MSTKYSVRYTVCNSIEMTHNGECDMLKYICSSVEMSSRGLGRVLTFQLRDIHICMSHKSIMRHLFCHIID